MSKLVSVHLKTKNMCKHTGKQFPFVMRSVPD